ncbi:hypothetical protein EPN42_06155 [bacterium]|nr:MAG: hypothetical protein EPN42_06155 [bacterium]
MTAAFPRECDIGVIGAGIGGLAASAYAAELGASVVCIEPSALLGGQVANVGVLGSYPAPAAVSGAGLAEALKERCTSLGALLFTSRVTAIEATGRGFAIATPDGTISAKSVVIASGGRLRQLDVPGAAELAGRGVSQCDWCDGGLFRDADVVVVGGGDAALQAALHLAEICRSVSVIVRGQRPRARWRYLQAAADSERISFFWETAVERVIGTVSVEAVVLRSRQDGSRLELPTRGVFVFIGSEPNASFVPPGVERDSRGLIVTDGEGRTSVAGIYAAGGVRSGYGGLIVQAIGEAAAAAAAAVEALG